MVRENPATHVDLPRMKRPEMQALKSDQARDLLKATEGTQYHPTFVLLLASGCRPSEALGLKWADIDWQDGTVMIRRAIYWHPNHKDWEITEPKTKKSRRTIPLGAAVIKILAELKKCQAEDRLRAGAGWEDTELVFTRASGAPADPRKMVRCFMAALKQAELPSSVRLYDLRHSCATILMAEGLNPKIISERLGHANVTMTLATYSHVSKGMQELASNRLENALFG
jgi:integrase